MINQKEYEKQRDLKWVLLRVGMMVGSLVSGIEMYIILLIKGVIH